MSRGAGEAAQIARHSDMMLRPLWSRRANHLYQHPRERYGRRAGVGSSGEVQ
jgi:hypothetical protein